AKSWYVPPPPPPPAPVEAPAAPAAPPLPYVFVGSYTEGDNATVYFLTRGDRVYDVKPGDTLDQIYSVDGVADGALLFTYKPLNIRQTLAIGGGT
ncbi:MAG: secretion system X translation initiation factor, partial [Steroidobacteraceae bacterium]